MALRALGAPPSHLSRPVGTKGPGCLTKQLAREPLDQGSPNTRAISWSPKLATTDFRLRHTPDFWIDAAPGTPDLGRLNQRALLPMTDLR